MPDDFRHQSLTLGAVLRELRKAGGLTQHSLADKLGIDPTYVSHLEADRREPSLRLLRRFADLLQVPFGLLLATVLLCDADEDDAELYSGVLDRLLAIEVSRQESLPFAERWRRSKD